ncbi:MAG: riboflavin synthase [Flavobacteriales bacterium]|nr:riboflavin synthase [Flavobacteriales bacterium]MBO72684.1 riboflavin synthase [Flavobacteriales bacterium]|tara:strand:+ start:1096 stop:1683 length:588 start_codon:yes stop_codon:yes gene_type:complete
MFTGIIEDLGELIKKEKEGDNVHFTFSCSFTNELRIDQSIAHNGICLTVVDIDGEKYTVTAIDETLKKTNIRKLKIGDKINLERCMKLGARLDGHIVQGHVDQTGYIDEIKNEEGSWKFYIKYDSSQSNITVEKGSVTVNGTSLTVVDSGHDFFSVCIIPYTYHHTNFQYLIKGSEVNLEFDIIGKYLTKLYRMY